jgi:hypothetical protein
LITIGLLECIVARRKERTTARRQTTYVPRGKSENEARVERFTWFFLVLIFALLNLVVQNGSNIPNWIIPFAGSMVLLGSGFYQYRRGWRVSPITWLAGALLAFFALLNLYMIPTRSFLSESLLIFAAVILLGLITGET